ncbi:MAG: TolC family protein [Verrucomicrobiales bacterium]|nr:TolC family protein [Verrucomicrobiales bacterium]
MALSQGQDRVANGGASERAPRATGAFVPGGASTDTLSTGDPAVIQTGEVGLSGGEPVLLAAKPTPAAGDDARSTSLTAPVETFLQAEPRVRALDDRFQTPVAAAGAAKPAATEVVSSSAVTAVSVATSGRAPLSNDPLPAFGVDVPKPEQRTPETLIRQIEELRSGTYAPPASAVPVVATSEARAKDEAPAQAAPRRESTPAVGSDSAEAPQPYAFAQPVRTRPNIGQQVSARTLAAERTEEEGGAYAAAAPVAGEEQVVAEVGNPAPAPFADVAAAAPPPASPERKGLLGRLFAKKPTREERAAELAAAANRSSVEQFPRPDAPRTKPSKTEDEAQAIIDRVYGYYSDAVSRITAEDLVANGKKGLAPVPSDLETVWLKEIRSVHRKGDEPLAVRLEEVYARALANSNRVKVYGYDPLIRETGIQEAEGLFDLEAFTTGNYSHNDDPTSSPELETGDIGRRLENRGEAEAGFRRRFATGGMLSLSNRFMTLDSNSEFLDPNPQTTSSLVLSVAQPLLKGAGYHYNKARLKVAKIEAGMAAAEYVARLENHLMEVNNAYWGVYFNRAAYLLRKSLVTQTSEIVETLEARADEATASELLRARSELSRRRTALNRAEMAVRNAEEKLRSLINDPEFPVGGPGEFIPVTAPILTPPKESVQGAALQAVDNRAEIAHSFGQLRSAAIRHEAGKNEMLPQLDLMAESRLAGMDANRRVAGAYDDMLGQQASWMAGFQFSQPLENNSAKARQERLQYELMQQEHSVKATMDTILLESVTTFRELMTVYRDMQGNYQQVLSTREELRGLRERLDVDANNEQTVAYRLQNVMDALERSQIAEEQFLISVVTYNMSFATLEKAKGTFLKVQDVEIERSPLPGHKRLESLQAVPRSAAGSAEDQGRK